jgi:hypothetical protein
VVPREREPVIAVGALGVTAALFVLFAVVGYPIVDALFDAKPLQRALLAPVAGLCTLTFPVATLNHVGLPVRSFGVPVLAVALVAAAVYYVRRRPPVPWREMLPFAVVLLLALAVAAWPMTVFNFDWLAFGNDDMTTYTLSANHFFAHGYFQLPSANDLIQEHDPSWNTSFFYSYAEVRYAAPLMLAWVMSITGLSSGAAFMPMIVALHLVAIVSAVALVAARNDGGRTALIACLLLAVSANLLSGTLRQLLPQDFGLALLAGAAVTLLRRPPEPRPALLRRAALGALFVGTLVIEYPEVLPFLFAPALLYVLLSLVRRREGWRSWGLVAGVVAVGVLVVANENLPGAVSLFLRQAQVATAAGSAYDRVLFGEFLTPLVFPLLWGFTTVGAAIGPWSAFAVVCGGIATIGAYVAAVRYGLALEPAALILLVMLTLAVQLEWNGGSFGVFKITMYVQPFLMCTLACCVSDLIDTRRRRSAA